MQRAEKTLTRKGFLKMAGAAGMALAGAPVFGSGCGRWSDMNVVMVIIDSLRKDHVGAYGNPWIKTPTLDSLAKQSLRFTRAYPEAMPTICARRAIHTGMRTWPFRDRPAQQRELLTYGWLPIPDWQPTLAEILREQGYRTAMVTDTYHQFDPTFRFTMNFDRGFDIFRKIRGQERDAYKDVSAISEKQVQHYLTVAEYTEYKTRQYLANTAGRQSEEDWFAPKVFLGAAEVLEELRLSEPFFLVVDGFDPHEPWDPPEKYVNFYDPEDYRGPKLLYSEYRDDSYLTDRQLGRMRALYAAETTMADRWLGTLLERAHDLGLMENTLLILISDHGHALGEHDVTGKPAYALWPEVTDITFCVRHPDGRGAGQTSDYYASTHDVAPTVLGLLGIEPSKPMQGQDLSVLFNGEEPEPRGHFTLGYHDYVWTRDARHVMFSRNDRSEARLYDVGEDPKMNNDLARERPETVQRMFEEYVLEDAGGRLPIY